MSMQASCPRRGGPYGARRSAGRSFTPVSRRAGSEEGQMSNVWRRFWEDESGQSLVEYVLIVALVAIALIGAIALMRNAMGNRFNDITECLEGVSPEDCETGES